MQVKRRVPRRLGPIGESASTRFLPSASPELPSRMIHVGGKAKAYAHCLLPHLSSPWPTQHQHSDILLLS